MVKKKTSKNKKLISRRKIFFGLLLFCLALAILYVTLNHTSTRTSAGKNNVANNNKIDYSPAKPSDNAANESRKSSNQTSVNNTLNSPVNAPAFSVTVSRANSTSTERQINVAATVNGASSGTCTFDFSPMKNGDPTVFGPDEAVQMSNQSAFCPPQIVTMPSRGDWYVSVSVTNAGMTAKDVWPLNPVKL